MFFNIVFCDFLVCFLCCVVFCCLCMFWFFCFVPVFASRVLFFWCTWLLFIINGCNNICCEFLRFFKRDLDTLLLFCLYWIMCTIFVHTTYWVLSLFSLTHSPLLLLAGGFYRFLILRSFGLSVFVCFVHFCGQFDGAIFLPVPYYVLMYFTHSLPGRGRGDGGGKVGHTLHSHDR